MILAAAHAAARQSNASGWLILAVLAIGGAWWIYRKLKG